jgi:hypothetical protein
MPRRSMHCPDTMDATGAFKQQPRRRACKTVPGEGHQHQRPPSTAPSTCPPCAPLWHCLFASAGAAKLPFLSQLFLNCCDRPPSGAIQNKHGMVPPRNAHQHMPTHTSVPCRTLHCRPAQACHYKHASSKHLTLSAADQASSLPSRPASVLTAPGGPATRGM